MSTRRKLLTAKESDRVSASLRVQDGLRASASQVVVQKQAQPFLSQATHIALPHPNANSHYYDRIMSGGVFDPRTGNIKVNNEMKLLSYSQWMDEKLAPEAREALKRENLAQIPTFKRKPKKVGILVERGQSSNRTAQKEQLRASREELAATDPRDFLRAVTGDPNATMPGYYKSLKQQREQWSLGALLSSINDAKPARKDEDDASELKLPPAKTARRTTRA